MVYDTKTYKVFHQLTEEGQFHYFAMLEHKADELLFKKKHFFLYWWQRVRNWVKTGDSEWIGPEYPDEEKYQDGFSYGHQGN